MFVKAGSLTLHLDLHGPEEAPVLILLHSLGTSLHLWDPQLTPLAQRYRVVRLDMRGHGSSEAGAAPFLLGDLAADVLAVADHLGIGTFAVAGVSIGGMIAQKVADLAPHRVSAMVLVDTSLVTAIPDAWKARAADVRAHGLDHLVDEIVARWVTPDFIDAPGAAGLRQMLRRTSADGFAGCADALAQADLRGPVATPVPTLVVVGDKDLSTPLAAAEALAAARSARLTVIADAAHIPNLERPAELTAAMLAFLAATDTARRAAA